MGRRPKPLYGATVVKKDAAVLWLSLTGQKIAFGTAVLVLGCAERSSPQSRVRRVEGAGLDGECADRATIIVAATREFVQRV
jgi:hypothetical protein